MVTAALDPLRPIAGEGVAIVGFGPTRNLAPWDDPTWEKWLCNRLPLQPGIGPWDRHFDPHHLAWTESHFAALQGKPELWTEYRDWMAADHGPDKLLYIPDPQPWMPNSVRLPVEELVAHVGRSYFTSAIAWQIGMALLLGARQIGLWGIDFKTDTEYGFERPCAEWLLGIAQGRGVEVVLPHGAGILNNGFAEPLYGVAENETHLADLEKVMVARLREIDRMMPELQSKNDALLRELYIGEGAKHQTAFFLQLIREARRGGPIAIPEVIK